MHYKCKYGYEKQSKFQNKVENSLHKQEKVVITFKALEMVIR